MIKHTRPSTPNGLRKRMASLVRRFVRDERGVSAIEFAVVSPFLLATWLGTVTLLDTENTTTKIGKVTATVADIIAQAPVANGAFINAAFNAGKAMLGNIGNDNLKIYVAGIEIKADQTLDVKWICGRRFTEEQMESAVDTFDLPSELKQTPGFIIASYGEYKHSPMFGQTFSGDQTYKYNNYFVPRNSLVTLNEGCDG